MMWSEKYRPKNILDLVGNEEPRKLLVEWFTKWKKGLKPILLVGPPGIGKTTLANLIAKQFNYDLISLNASDVRNRQRNFKSSFGKSDCFWNSNDFHR